MLLNLEDLTPFYDRLKKRTDKDIRRLAKVILKEGFTCPFFVWQVKNEQTVVTNILDGNGRYYALKYLQETGYILPKLPVVLIQASDLKEARLKILEVNSRNGLITKEAFLAYASSLGLVCDDFHIPELDLPDVENTEVSDKDTIENYRTITCPHCSSHIEIRTK